MRLGCNCFRKRTSSDKGPIPDRKMSEEMKRQACVLHWLNVVPALFSVPIACLERSEQKRVVYGSNVCKMACGAEEEPLRILLDG